MKVKIINTLKHKLQWFLLLAAMLTVSQVVWGYDVYMTPNNSWWANDNAKFCIWAWGTGVSGEYYHMECVSGTGGSAIYHATVDDTRNQLQFLRNNSSDTDCTKIWNRSGDLTWNSSTPLYRFAADGNSGSWEAYTPPCTEPTVTSNAASNITQNSATISGQYSGTCSDCETPTFTVSGGTLGTVTESSGVYSATVTGLSAGTQYSFTFDVPNACGTTSSTSRNFTTCTRTFDGSEYLYIDTGACSWFGNNNGVPALSFDGGSNYTDATLLSGKIYRILVPSGCYDEFILRRHCDNGNWDAHNISFAGTSGKNQFNVYSNWSGAPTSSTWTVYNSSSITIRISQTENMPFTPDKIYYWYNNGAGDVVLSAAWRGDDLGDDGTYYKAITVPAGHLKMIVNDGSHQTVDMIISDVTTSNTFCFKILSTKDGSGHYNYETADCCPTPTVSITAGPSAVCAGATSIVFTAVGATSDGTISSYTWNEPSNWTKTAQDDSNGTATYTIGAAGTVSVTATNSCEKTSDADTKAVSLKTAPSKPEISGEAIMCGPSSAGAYEFTSSDVSADSYNWQITGNASIASGGGTRTINVTAGDVDNDAVTLTVTAVNCSSLSTASDAKAITIYKSAAAGTVTLSKSAACVGETGLTASTSGTWYMGGGTGEWSSTATTYATVDAIGNITALAAGSPNIKYTIKNPVCGSETYAQSQLTISGPADFDISTDPASGYTPWKPITFTTSPSSTAAWDISTDPSLGQAYLSTTTGSSTVLKAPANVGNYTVSATKESGGCSLTKTQTITVTAPECD